MWIKKGRASGGSAQQAYVPGPSARLHLSPLRTRTSADKYRTRTDIWNLSTEEEISARTPLILTHQVCTICCKPALDRISVKIRVQLLSSMSCVSTSRWLLSTIVSLLTLTFGVKWLEGWTKPLAHVFDAELWSPSNYSRDCQLREDRSPSLFTFWCSCSQRWEIGTRGSV